MKKRLLWIILVPLLVFVVIKIIVPATIKTLKMPKYEYYKVASDNYFSENGLVRKIIYNWSVYLPKDLEVADGGLDSILVRLKDKDDLLTVLIISKAAVDEDYMKPLLEATKAKSQYELHKMMISGDLDKAFSSFTDNSVLLQGKKVSESLLGEGAKAYEVETDQLRGFLVKKATDDIESIRWEYNLYGKDKDSLVIYFGVKKESKVDKAMIENIVASIVHN